MIVGCISSESRTLPGSPFKKASKFNASRLFYYLLLIFSILSSRSFLDKFHCAKPFVLSKPYSLCFQKRFLQLLKRGFRYCLPYFFQVPRTKQFRFLDFGNCDVHRVGQDMRSSKYLRNQPVHRPQLPPRNNALTKIGPNP